jgi:hypothetical protein
VTGEKEAYTMNRQQKNKKNIYQKQVLVNPKKYLISGLVSIFIIIFISGCIRYASLNGLSLVGDPGTGSVVGYLGDGTGFGLKEGDTFSFAPIQLPHGAEIKRLRCIVRDNTPKGYIQVTLNRGPININTTDPIIPIQNIASAVTSPATVNPDFQEITGNAKSDIAIVDNTKYGYFFRVDFLDSPGVVGPEVALKLRGCSVEYVQ